MVTTTETFEDIDDVETLTKIRKNLDTRMKVLKQREIWVGDVHYSYVTHPTGWTEYFIGIPTERCWGGKRRKSYAKCFLTKSKDETLSQFFATVDDLVELREKLSNQ